jgi:hypothetical protein
VRKLKILMLTFSVMSLGALVSCSKSSTKTTPAASSADTVMYSAWIPLALVLQSPASDSFYEQAITAAALTQAILDKGMVNVYVHETGTGTSYVNSASDEGIYPTYAVGQIFLDAYGSNGAVLATNTYFDEVRYVIIPGTVSVTNANGSIQTYTPAQLKELDYATLTKLLGIPAKGSTLK